MVRPQVNNNNIAVPEAVDVEEEEDDNRMDEVVEQPCHGGKYSLLVMLL